MFLPSGDWNYKNKGVWKCYATDDPTKPAPTIPIPDTSGYFDSEKQLFVYSFPKVYKFKELANFRTMIRIKINAYPHTNEVKEHIEHFDYPFSHKGALFSLNTCDGYTKFNDGTKVESVANRIIFFDASKNHQSTTTSNAKLRYNINFNFL